jgi:hypothetical protein
MIKIPTLFYRDPNNLSLVSQDLNPESHWVLSERDEAIATLKRDGVNVRVVITRTGPHTTCLLEKRRNPTRKQKLEGMRPYYVPTSRQNPEDEHLFAAFDATNYDMPDWPDGAWPCEALGPKIQGGVESPEDYYLYPFSLDPEFIRDPISDGYTPADAWHALRMFFGENLIEGIVWHHKDGRMAKIKRRDFGYRWPVTRTKRQEAG